MSNISSEKGEIENRKNAISEKIEIENWLPYGEQLRILLGSEHISYGEASSILRSKGVFCCFNEKPNTIPILTSSILRPCEFSALLEASISRESKPKESPDEMQLADASSNWTGALREMQENLDKQIKLDAMLGVIFSKAPEIYFVDRNQAIISYSVDRQDYSKDLLWRDLTFKANILIKQIEGKLELVSQYTSKETDKINDQIIRVLRKEFFNRGVTQSTESNKIFFYSFSNKNRILFLLRLAGGFHEKQPPGKIIDINIKKNEGMEELPSSSETWLLERTVRNLKIDGDELNKILILSRQEYYDYFFLTNITVEYSFEVGQHKGSCTIVYSFRIGRGGLITDKTAFSHCMEKFHLTTSKSLRVLDAEKTKVTQLVREKINAEFQGLKK